MQDTALMSIDEMFNTLTMDERFLYRAECRTVGEQRAWLVARLASKAGQAAGRAAYTAKVKARQQAELAQATGKAGR